jgi:DNA-binding NarL/FixJ family response regulator
MSEIRFMERRILLADDYELWRQGLKTLLESHPEWKVCGEAANGEEAIARTRELCPDVIVLDLTMPVVDGFQAARQILQKCPDTKVLILTMHDSAEVIRQVRAIGVHGLVVKSAASHQLVTALESLFEDRTFFATNLPGA